MQYFPVGKELRPYVMISKLIAIISFSIKTFVLGAQNNVLIGMVLLNIINICFSCEIRNCWFFYCPLILESFFVLFDPDLEAIKIMLNSSEYETSSANDN